MSQEAIIGVTMPAGWKQFIEQPSAETARTVAQALPTEEHASLVVRTLAYRPPAERSALSRPAAYPWAEATTCTLRPG